LYLYFGLALKIAFSLYFFKLYIYFLKILLWCFIII